MPTPNEFSRIDFSRAPASQDASEPEASQFGPYPGPDLVPTEGTPKQWQVSSDKASTPEAMATETQGSDNAFAELQQFLMNSLPTAGSRVCNDQSKPWTPPHGAEGEK
jgi:hypothetical protein